MLLWIRGSVGKLPSTAHTPGSSGLDSLVKHHIFTVVAPPPPTSSPNPSPPQRAGAEPILTLLPTSYAQVA